MFKKFLLILISVPTLLCAQHKITGTFTPAENYKWVLLYELTPQNTEYIERATIDGEGKFEFVLDKKNTKGLYKLVYDVPQEQYNFDIIYNGSEDIEFNFNSETGLEYVASQENKLMTSYTKSMGMVNQSIGSFYSQKSQDSSALVAIFKTLKDTQDEYEKIAQGTIALNFIKANRPYLPKGYEDANTYVKNIKAHYFDHVDFNNEALLSSSFLIERVLNYIFGMSGKGATETEVYINNTKDVAKALEKAKPETQKTIYGVLWQQLADASYEETANFIGDTYLGPLAKQFNDQDLLTKMALFKSLTNGNKAPDFDIPNNGEQNKLSKLNTSKYYIVVFWSSVCSHCLEELPQLQEFVKNVKEEELKVIAFGLEDDKDNWEKVIKSFPKFLHVIGLGKWDNEIGNNYNVTATPTYFVLDEDKNILAKPIDFEELLSVFN